MKYLVIIGILGLTVWIARAMYKDIKYQDRVFKRAMDSIKKPWNTLEPEDEESESLKKAKDYLDSKERKDKVSL